MTNHLLQYYLKRNAFYKVSFFPIEYLPRLLLHYVAVFFLPFIVCFLHDMHTIIYSSCIK
jgi:hypothetical protein